VAGYFRKRRHFKATQIAALYASAARVRRTVDISGLNEQGRHTVVFLARKWKDMDQETRDKFFKDVQKAKGE
jgi:hypothetical protein